MASSKLRAIIVGGGIAGLTLANALEKAGFDYVLLERLEEIAPRVGAFVGITVNGLRILDQLGCYEAIEDNNASIEMLYNRRWKDGSFVRGIDALIRDRKRFGYPFLVMDRHFLLQTLYDNIEDKSRIVPGKKVFKVEHSDEVVSVECNDGSTYTGDLVIGADGVHSIVRQEMWRHMDESGAGLLVSKERTLMSAEYKCMYGVSPATEGFSPGTFNSNVGRDMSFLWTVHKDGRVFWAVFQKLDKKYHMPNIPRFTEKDALALGEHCKSSYMTEKVKFRDLWENRMSHILIPLEEAFYKHWNWGRFACIGDVVHKWTPSTGQGANNAIESAAAAANALYRLSRRKTPCSKRDVQEALSEIQKHREIRAKNHFTATGDLTRLEAMKTPMHRFMMTYIVPHLSDALGDQLSWANIGAEKLEYLPDPPKSLSGIMAFNQNYGPGGKSLLLRRMVFACPLLMLSYFTYAIFSSIISEAAVRSAIRASTSSGKLNNDDHSWDAPIRIKPFIDSLTFFSPSLFNIYPVHRLQAITLLIDLAPLWFIWILESHREGNAMKLITVPIVFGLAFQRFGIGVVGPIWFFLHYISCPLSDYAGLDWRLVNVAAAKTALPAILATTTLPTLAMYFDPNFHRRLAINAVWQAFPLWTTVIHYILRKTAIADTTKHDRIYNVYADLPSIRFAIKVLAGISGLTFNWVRCTSHVPISRIFFPNWALIETLLRSAPASLDFVPAMSTFLQVDETVCFIGAFFWMALLFYDLKEAEMIGTSWYRLALCACLGTFVAGPGATVSLGWLWREEILAVKKAKGSVGTEYLVQSEISIGRHAGSL